MASIRDFAFTEGTVAAASFDCDMPVHESGDLLLAFTNQDGSATPNLPSGWTNIDNNTGSGHGWRVFYKVATSSSETLTVTITSDTFTCTVVSIKDADTNDPINVSEKRTADDSSNPFAGIGATTDEDNCLVFQFLSTDGGTGPTCDPPWTNLTNGDAGANSGGLAYIVKKYYGAIPAPNWWGAINDNTNAFIVAINDASTPVTLQGYIQQDTDPGEFLEAGIFATTNVWGNSYPISLSLAAIGSKTTVYDVATAQTDQGLNPYWPVANCTPAASSTGVNVGGPQVDFGSAKDLENGIVFFNFFFTTSRDYVDCSTPTDAGQAGILFITRDGSAYKAWSVGAKNTVTTKPDGYNITCIQVDQTTNTKFASSGTHADDAVDGFLTLAQGKYGAVAFRWGNVCIAYEFALAGGTSGTPLNFDDVDFVLNRSLGQQRVMLREGSAATFLVPIKIGGTDPVHIEVNLRTLQYRKQADGVDYLDWHVDDNKCGFEFDGQSGDTIKFRNCVFVSGSPTYWRFNSGHNLNAAIDFSGSTIINQTVTLQSSVSLELVTFVSCSAFTQNSAELDNCTFQDTKITANDIENISNCSFISGGTGHAIEIPNGATGTYTFTGNTFSGYGAGGTDNAAIYNNSGGAVTINVVGGDTPTIKNGASASTTVNNNVTVKITVKDATTKAVLQGARVYLKTDPGGTVIFNELSDVNGKVEDTYNYTANEDVVGRVRLYGATKYKTGDIVGEITSNGFETTILLIPDE